MPSKVKDTWAVPSSVINPTGLFAQMPDGSWEAVQLDSSGNVLTSSSGGGGGGGTVQLADGTTPSQKLSINVSGQAAIQAPPTLPLPAGAATSANQPGFGTAGTPSANVSSVQGISGGTPVPIGGNVASLSSDSGNPIKVGGVYNTSAPAPTNGQRVDIQVDSAGNLKETLATLLAGEDLTNNLLAIINKAIVSSTYSPSNYFSAKSGTLVVKDNIKSTAANVLSLLAVNLNAATRYLWLTNANTAPANALASSDASVIDVIAMPTLTTLKLGTDYFTQPGFNTNAGYSFGFSTSATSFTAGTNTDHTLSSKFV